MRALGSRNADREIDLPARIDALSRAAASAGVVVYGVSEAPAFSSVRDVSLERAQAKREEGSFLYSGLQSAVEETGGPGVSDGGAGSA